MRIIEYTPEIDINELLDRKSDPGDQVRDIVIEIIENVKDNGDQALKDYSKKFDNVNLENLRVTEEEIQEALTLVEDNLKEIYKEASENIRNYHQEQKSDSWQINKENGIMLGQKVTPIKEIGIYVPGGKAAYPSTVLMDAIPAQVAGVERIAMVTPPNKEGKVDPHILAAANIIGIDEIYKVGGAQAVAALAYGTESIKPVSKIVGPGNAFVATAKKEVFGKVDIDMIAGPSEVLVIADKSANPSFIAADLLAQAEHDQMAMPILITDDQNLANSISEEIERQIAEDINRKEIAQASIDDYCFVFIVNDLEEAYSLANDIAPEHLELLIEDPHSGIDSIKNAGAIFIGSFTPEPVGDYFAGPNHTLPTSGTAKFSSPLGVYDFQKRSSLIYYPEEAFNNIADKVIDFAESEGLDAHANSIRQRKIKKN